MKQLALVGAGNWGKNLVRNFYALGVLHTICDPREGLLDTFQEAYPDVKCTTNFKAILADKAITQVVIAAPAILHYTLAKQALEAGKDTYVEKPLCLDCKEAEELIDLAEQNNCILMVGHLLQYHPCVIHIQNMVRDGEIGKLQYIVSNRLNLGSIRTEENALWNFAPHDISVILSLAGDQIPEKVRCIGADYVTKDVADTSMTTLAFEGGLRAHIYVSWLNPFKEQRLVIVGSDAMLIFDDTKPWEEKLTIIRNYVKWCDGKTPKISKESPQPLKVPQSEPLRNECEHFLSCCKSRKQPRTGAEEGLRVLKVLQAAQASLEHDGEAVYPSAQPLPSLAKSSYFAHPTAVIDENATIGTDSKIWHFSHLMSGCILGDSCNIGQNVVISPNVTLGRNVKVQNNISIYTGVIIEDDVFLGPSMVFTNIRNPRSAISRKDSYLSTTVQRGATIGANATILCGICIGANSFIGAGSVITKDVKPFALLIGNPARQIGWMSRHGERLDLPLTSITPLQAACPATGEVYELLGDSLTIATLQTAMIEEVLK